MMGHSTSPHPLHGGEPRARRHIASALVQPLAKTPETTLFVVLLLIVGGTSLAKPQFLNLQNLRDVLLNVSIVSLLTAGMTIVILMRHIDLSVGSTVGVSAYAVGSLY
ncbi:MAG: ABC transporter permease, partial [Paraburkholderia tropica]